MICYASRTGTRRNLDALRDAGWRLMVSARGVLRTEGFSYALDNGAWTAHQKGEPFDVAAFEKALDLLGPGADFVVCPDVVMDAQGTLGMAREWLARCLDKSSVALIAVQNGMTWEDVCSWVCPRIGIFVGGDSTWKELTAHYWAVHAHSRGAICHVGRVNTARRIAICSCAGVDSIDGSSASRFSVTLPMLDAAARQGVMEAIFDEYQELKIFRAEET